MSPSTLPKRRRSVAVRYGCCVLILLPVILLAGYWGTRSKNLKHVKTLPHLGNVVSLAFSPDGKYVAAGTKSVLSQMWIGQVKVWGTNGFKELETLDERQWINSLAFSPDSSVLAVACGRYNHTRIGGFNGFQDQPGEIKLYGTKDWKIVKSISEPAGISAVEFSPNGKLLAAIVGIDPTEAGYVNIYDASTLENIRTLRLRDGPITSMAFSADGKFLAAVDSLGYVQKYIQTKDRDVLGIQVHVLQVEGWKLNRTISMEFGPIARLLFTRENDTLVAVPYLGGITRFFDLSTGRDISPKQPVSGGSDAAFSPDGKRLAIGNWTQSGGGFNSRADLWDLSPLKRTAWRKMHDVQLNAVAFSPDGKLFVTGVGGNVIPGSVRVFEVRMPNAP